MKKIFGNIKKKFRNIKSTEEIHRDIENMNHIQN